MVTTRCTTRALAVSALICGVLACAGSASAQSSEAEVAVPGGVLLVDHPEDWKVAVSGPAVGRTVKLTAGGLGDSRYISPHS